MRTAVRLHLRADMRLRLPPRRMARHPMAMAGLLPPPRRTVERRAVNTAALQLRTEAPPRPPMEALRNKGMEALRNKGTALPKVDTGECRSSLRSRDMRLAPAPRCSRTASRVAPLIRGE